jgi:hypothetical protein
LSDSSDTTKRESHGHSNARCSMLGLVYGFLHGTFFAL